MELLKNLFEGYPNLWGGGVAHSVLILSLVIAFGIMLGKIKISGISLGVTWILFVGIVFGHFNLNLNEHLLHFLKEFGLILFVYSIGLQVGPGFFSAFKKGGFTLNMLAMGAIFISVVITIILHFTTGTPITTMVGILSGAVTNTPGLGAAQQANSDLNGIDAPEIAMGYAVAYPLGVVGAILSLLALKYILNIKTSQEEADAEKGLGQYVIGDNIQGLNRKMIEDYIQYLGNLRWSSLGFGPLYEENHKEPESMHWVSQYSNANMVKTDFFEAKSTAYAKSTALEDDL